VETDKKIINFSDLAKNSFKFKNKKVVLVGGCFDLFHYGHLQFLKDSSKLGDYLIIALESDDFIKNNKKREPVHNQNQRAEILANIKLVNLIIKLPLFKNNLQYTQLVNKIKPNIIAVTTKDPKYKIKEKQANMVGAKIEEVTILLNKFSSKKIYEIISSN